MSEQGTWADNLIILGVADALNFKIIIIIESDSKFLIARKHAMFKLSLKKNQWLVLL